MGGGRIVLVGTPLGNLGDMSPRATAALGEATLIACEDTRRTGRLLQHLGLEAPRLQRMDEHTEAEVVPGLIEAAAGGSVVAVVSDAGMPVLSDPGGRLVAAAAEAGIGVEVVPGPFAAGLAASLSGLLDPTGRFVFEGFLPRKGRARKDALAEAAGSSRATVIYESPHRVADTIGELAGLCGGDRAVALCRELTKMHEETWRGTLAGAMAHLGDNPPRGEFVIVLAAAPPGAEPDDGLIRAALERRLSVGSTRRDAAAAVAQELGVAHNRAKKLANDL
jgi:16S rRNA (cytidine1402-2'-O)-methyltransferase